MFKWFKGIAAASILFFHVYLGGNMLLTFIFTKKLYNFTSHDMIYNSTKSIHHFKSDISTINNMAFPMNKVQEQIMTQLKVCNVSAILYWLIFTVGVDLFLTLPSEKKILWRENYYSEHFPWLVEKNNWKHLEINDHNKNFTKVSVWKLKVNRCSDLYVIETCNCYGYKLLPF